MPKDRDQLTPEEPEDAEFLETHRGQGTAGTGLDALPSEHTDALDDAGNPASAED